MTTTPTKPKPEDKEEDKGEPVELAAVRELRKEFVGYLAINHANRITGLAKELDCSLAVVSRYISNDRPMSGKFVKLVKQKLNGFNTLCDEALKAMAEDKWIHDKVDS